MSLQETVASIVERLTAIPDKADAALMIRHAERGDIPPGALGVDVPLTAVGVESADSLGAILAGIRPQVEVFSSPVPRCVQTAEAILRGVGRPEGVALDWRLGDPGPFVVDAEIGGRLFLEAGILEIARRQLTNVDPPAGMRRTSEGVDLMLDLATRDLRCQGRLNIYVTHDAILAVLVAYIYGLSIDEICWPEYLDGFLLWRSSGQLRFAWRGLQQSSHPLGG